MDSWNGLHLRNHLLPGDLGQVAAMHGRIYAEEHDFAIGFEAYVMECLMEFYSRYKSDRDGVWILEDGNRLVGFLALMHRPNQCAQLRFLILEKRYRGIGIGKKLMEEWIKFYHEKKYKQAYLYTTSGLDPAIELYKKFGFEKKSEIHSRYFGMPLLEIFFRLNEKKEQN